MLRAQRQSLVASVPGCHVMLMWACQYLQVVDLAQKISDFRGQVGGGLDEGITIPKVQSGLWVPQVTLPQVSLPHISLNSGSLSES